MVLCMGWLDDFCLVVWLIIVNCYLFCVSFDYLVWYGVLQYFEELQVYDGLVYYNCEFGGMFCLLVDGELVLFCIWVRMCIDFGYQLFEGVCVGFGLVILLSFLVVDVLLVGELLLVLFGYLLDGGQVFVVYCKI